MPAWMTPLLAPVCPPATAGPRSSTTAERSGRRRVSSRATASPRIPPPTTARSHSSGAATSASLLLRYAAREQVQIGVDHQLHHLLEGGRRTPAQLLARLARVADQVLDLRRAQEALVDPHVVGRVEPHVRERHVDQLAHRMS